MRLTFFPIFSEQSLIEMEMQVEAYLGTVLPDRMEFRSLYYRYAKVKDELQKVEEEVKKRAKQRSQ